MRTEHGKSWMESGLQVAIPEYTDTCGMCKRSPAPEVMTVRWSRNGVQSYSFNACTECRLDLIHHLSARD